MAADGPTSRNAALHFEVMAELVAGKLPTQALLISSGTSKEPAKPGDRSDFECLPGLLRGATPER